MKCQNCGTENRPDALFCMICGEELEEEEPMLPIQGICPECGTVNRPDALFCQNCGGELRPDDALDAAMPVGPDVDADELLEEAARAYECPYCGTINRPDALFCQNCGAVLE
ncbi:MAG: zinc ribbon domain-containing protein [Eubacteriaceae bacterium]|jgi:uncharacterized OB-fold protein|nr:zinc ribbon domain-containing protein [Eubacteriaceae bacterium]